MKALTLTQPWASLMATMHPDGRPQKTIETRGWATGYRGELVIHAAKGFPKWAQEAVRFEPEFIGALGHNRPEELPLSRGLCVVRVVGCVKTTELHKAEFILGRKPAAREIWFGDYAEGRFAWLTEYVRPLDDERIVRGALSLWEWPELDGVDVENVGPRK